MEYDKPTDNQALDDINNDLNNPQDQLLDQETEEYNNPNEEDEFDCNKFDELNEEEYLEELQRRVIQMKQERKNAEYDAQTLNNRLIMLKSEEEKTIKKIELTKKKANEKFQNLQNIADNKRQKEMIKEERAKEIEEKKMINQKMKEEMKNNFKLKKAEKQKQVLEEAKLVQLQKEYNAQLLQYFNNLQYDANKYKCEFIKSQYEEEKERKRLLEKERKARLKADLERQLLEEYRLKEESEEKKLYVEQEEIETLKRLQTKTQIQQDITDEMEKLNLKDVLTGQFKNTQMKNMRTSKKAKKGSV